MDVMDQLREKCPWNAAQTMESIRPMTEEEVYELSDAIMKGDMDATSKEIGDLLYHMVFYARIAVESGAFDIADCMQKIIDKMVFISFYYYTLYSSRDRGQDFIRDGSKYSRQFRYRGIFPEDGNGIPHIHLHSGNVKHAHIHTYIPDSRDPMPFDAE